MYFVNYARVFLSRGEFHSLSLHIVPTFERVSAPMLNLRNKHQLTFMRYMFGVFFVSFFVVFFKTKLFDTRLKSAGS